MAGKAASPLSNVGPLSDGEISRFADLVVKELSSRALSLPLEATTEREISFTAHWVRPAVHAVADALGERGLIVAGDGGATVAPLPFLGLLFTPDVTIHYRTQRLVAIEVKLIRPGSGQSSLTRGIGQAKIYQECGFPVSVLLALNAGGMSLRDQVVGVSDLRILIRNVSADVARFREEGE